MTYRPKAPKPSVIVHVATDEYCTLIDDSEHIELVPIGAFSYSDFPSRRAAKRALAKIIPTLPPKLSPDEEDRYRVKVL